MTASKRSMSRFEQQLDNKRVRFDKFTFLLKVGDPVDQGIGIDSFLTCMICLLHGNPCPKNQTRPQRWAKLPRGPGQLYPHLDKHKDALSHQINVDRDNKTPYDYVDALLVPGVVLNTLQNSVHYDNIDARVMEMIYLRALHLHKKQEAPEVALFEGTLA